jgi:hypothetical protein
MRPGSMAGRRPVTQNRAGLVTSLMASDNQRAVVEALMARSLGHSSRYCGGDLPTRLMTRG